MNKYELKFNKILERYFYNIFNNYNIIKILELLFEKNVKKIAIWGAGEHTRKLFEYFPNIMKNTVCIIDNDIDLNGKELNGIKIIHSKFIAIEDVECIILSTFSSRKTITEQIKQIDVNIKVIDLYEYLENEHNIFLDTPFYIKRNVYLDIDNARKQIEKAEDKYSAIKETIYLYLSIRDIYNANRYIDKYINKISKKRKAKLLNLQLEINNLVDELRTDINKRKGKDLVLLFFDSIRAKDIYGKSTKMPYLKSTLKESTYFTNAFSTGIVTNESIPSMFSGKMPFYNKLYTRNCLLQKECPFICEALKKQYKVKIYSEKIWHMIDGENIEFEIFKDYVPYNLWKGITDLVSSNNDKCIYILYFLREPHPPHACGKHKNKIVGHVTLFTNTDSVDQSQKDFSNQYYECLKYIDEQLEFYENIILGNLNEVIFSDHGQVVEQAKKNVYEIGTLASWHDEKYHIPIILKHNKLKAHKCESLFSTINFNELIIGLLNDRLNIKKCDIVEMNFSRTQNSIIRNNYIKYGCSDYINGYKVFRNDKYKVAITGDGIIKVYSMKDENKEILEEDLKEQILKNFSNVVSLDAPQLDEKVGLYKDVF